MGNWKTFFIKLYILPDLITIVQYKKLVQSQIDRLFKLLKREAKIILNCKLSVTQTTVTAAIPLALTFDAIVGWHQILYVF